MTTTAADSSAKRRSDMEARYQSRLNRYVTAMRKGKPDMIPIRPFVAEFTGVYAGYTCQELAHDYHKAFAAARKCAADFDWDAVVANMVYVWTGPDAGDRPEVLRHSRHPHSGQHGFSIPRAVAAGRFHAGGRVRSTDRGPDRLSAERLAAAGFFGGAQGGRARHRGTQSVVPQGRHGDDGVLRRLWPADCPAALGIGHGLGHRRDVQGADGHHRRQAAGLLGTGRGPVRAARRKWRPPARR